MIDEERQPRFMSSVRSIAKIIIFAIYFHESYEKWPDGAWLGVPRCANRSKGWGMRIRQFDDVFVEVSN